MTNKIQEPETRPKAEESRITEELKCRLSELLERERELMIADIQAVMEGTGARGVRVELAEVRRKLSSLKRTITDDPGRRPGLSRPDDHVPVSRAFTFDQS